MFLRRGQPSAHRRGGFRNYFQLLFFLSLLYIWEMSLIIFWGFPEYDVGLLSGAENHAKIIVLSRVFYALFIFIVATNLRRSRAKFRVSCHRLFVFCHGKQIEFFVTIKLKKSRELFPVFSREIGKLWKEKKTLLSKICSKLRVQICFLRTSSKWLSHRRI